MTTYTVDDEPEAAHGAPLYHKCAHCHLFVEPNSEWSPGSGLAMYDHLHRGDEADEAVISTHEAWPHPGAPRTLDDWQRTGPQAMRERFTGTEIVTLKV